MVAVLVVCCGCRHAPRRVITDEISPIKDQKMTVGIGDILFSKIHYYGYVNRERESWFIGKIFREELTIIELNPDLIRVQYAEYYRKNYVEPQDRINLNTPAIWLIRDPYTKIFTFQATDKLIRYSGYEFEILSLDNDKMTYKLKDTGTGQLSDVTRLIDELRSNDLLTKKAAAKEIYLSHFADQSLFGVVHEELLKGYQLSSSDRHHVDTMAWLCKALGASGMTEYKVTLEKIAETSSSEKLRNYARQGLDMLK